MLLASYLRSYGIEAKIWDYSVEIFSEENLVRRLKNWQPDIAAFTALTSNINNAACISRTVKNYNIDIRTVVGGVHASALPLRTLKEFPSFDLLIYGEGEKTLLEVVESIRDNTHWSAIKGLCYRENDEIIMNGPRELIKDINEIPFPAGDLISRPLYRGSAARGLSSTNTNIDYILTSRGCMGKCTFCGANIVFNGRLRFRSVKNVLEEVKELKHKYKTEHIIIMDDTFTTSAERLMDICNGIKSLGISWSCYGKVDLVDEEKIRIMAESFSTVPSQAVRVKPRNMTTAIRNREMFLIPAMANCGIFFGAAF